jgi:hypothetical protein
VGKLGNIGKIVFRNKKVPEFIGKHFASATLFPVGWTNWKALTGGKMFPQKFFL